MSNDPEASPGIGVERTRGFGARLALCALSLVAFCTETVWFFLEASHVRGGVWHAWSHSVQSYTMRTSCVDVVISALLSAALTLSSAVSLRWTFGSVSLLRFWSFAVTGFAIAKVAIVFHHEAEGTALLFPSRATEAMSVSLLSFALAAVAGLELCIRDPGIRAEMLSARSTAHGTYARINADAEDALAAAESSGAKGDDAETKKKTPLRFSSVKRLLTLTGPDAGLIITATVFLVLGSLVNLLVPLLFGRIITSVQQTSPEAGRRELRRAVLQLLVIFAVGAVLAGLRGWLFELCGEKLVCRVRIAIYGAIMSMETGFFDTTRTGELLSRLSSDAEVIESAATVNVSMFLRSLVATVGGVVALFLISWRLTLLSLALVPLISISAVFYGKLLKEYQSKFQSELAKAATTAEETITQIRTVRAFSREHAERKRYAASIAETLKIGRMIAVVYGWFIFGVTLASELAILAVLYVGGLEVIEGTVSAGLLTSFLLYTLTIGINLASLTSLFGQMMQAVGASERIFELLDRKPLIPVEGGATTLPGGVTGSVELRNVCFTYPSRPDVQVLNDFSLALRPGQVIAVVGPSGGGKSTVVSTILRFYDVNAGAVLIDGVDVRELNLRWLRRSIGVVPQDPALFACSIRDNIAYGADAELRDEDIVRAAKEANIHETILSFPDGYNTLVGERGVRLSGGQRQRIAIARALVLNPRLLLLDEATSALDAESEHLVKQAIDRMIQSGGRATLIIAHRLSTVRNANLVVVVDKGRVVEQGTHEELIAADGLYKKLVARQLQGSGDDETGAAGVGSATQE